MKSSKEMFGKLLSSLLLALTAAVLADLTSAFFGRNISSLFFFAIIILIFTISMMVKKPASFSFKLLLGVLSVFAIAAVSVATVHFCFRNEASYKSMDEGKEELFSGHRVLVIAPHQDDEINIAGGVIEEYIRYGSDVYLAYMTNGDFSCEGETRLNEALNVAAGFGIKEENVYFLGYGDQTAPKLYYMGEDDICTSAAGVTETYGLDDHPAYNDGKKYTKNNLRQDFTELLLELKPDIIISNEIENHIDHAVLSLFFDEAMKDILTEYEDYHPLLLRSSCYATAYYGKEDFHCLNIKSVEEPLGHYCYANAHDWSERVRFPVDSNGLSRSLFDCKLYKLLKMHESQRARMQAEGIISGDKVYWLRDTNSILYDADLVSSSGNHKFINDFKLLDSYDLSSEFYSPNANVWIPDSKDTEKSLTIKLKEPSHIERICLYDNISEADNVKNARIVFDDGSELMTGPLKTNGAPTMLCCSKENVSSIKIFLTETQGAYAGLAEVEAYSTAEDYGLDFIKLQNQEEDFVYDYIIDKSGTEKFTVYTGGKNMENVSVECDNSKCSAYTEGKTVTVNCPEDEECILKLSSEDGKYKDTVRISNKNRQLINFGIELESQIRQFRKYNLQKCNMYKLMKSAYDLIR